MGAGVGQQLEQQHYSSWVTSSISLDLSRLAVHQRKPVAKEILSGAVGLAFSQWPRAQFWSQILITEY